MKTNSIHWGLIALSLLCGGALHLEATSTARAQAPQTPWGTVVAQVAGYGPVLINPNTNAAYFLTSPNSNQVTVLDGTTNQITAQITIPAGGTGSMWFDARQDRLYALGGPNFVTVTVIDAKTNSVINTISLAPPQSESGVGPTFLAGVNSATGKLYGTYNGPGGLLAVWDLATGALIETMEVDFPISGAINPKNNRFYVLNNFAAQLLVVDGVTNQVIDSIQTGQAYFPDGCYDLGPCITQSSAPFGVAFSEKTNRIYVDDNVDGTLYVVDGKTDRVIAGPVAVGQGVAQSSLDDVHDVLYLVNEEMSTASALDLKTMKPLGAPVPAGTPASPPGCLFSPSGNCTEYGSFAGPITINPANNKAYVVTALPDYLGSYFILVVQGQAHGS